MTNASPALPDQPRILGHPAGLFGLFFTEMWERFSYYGMRALLVFYMIKGFLRFGDDQAYAVYGAYTALVYATPFIGGMLADRLLGARRAVVIGGTLMAAGHLTMTVQHESAFFVALALLIAGNGFFKPNISTIVGSLYQRDPSRKDAGFTLFYMGINLGAAMAPLLCGYIGENYGWHYGFGLASIGMLIGLAVFVAPTRLTQALILAGALTAAAAMVLLQRGLVLLLVNGLVALALLIAAAIAVLAIGRAPLPSEAGAPPDPTALSRRWKGILRVDLSVYLAIAAAIAVLALLVRQSGIAGLTLTVFGLAALFSLLVSALRAPALERDRLLVVLVLMFFSMLFWAFFEQAGSSINNFTDRNVDRVDEAGRIAQSDVGRRIRIAATQEQLGYPFEGRPFTLDRLTLARERGQAEMEWEIAPAHVGMGVGGIEVPASVFQSANPILILLLGLVFSAVWAFLGARNLEPSTPLKFALGILQLGLGFGALWYGTEAADGRGMVSVGWLLAGYLLHTTGELCLSPVGLSMVTSLSPRRIVSTVMGAWFLATAFSNYLAGIIAALTGVHGAEEGGMAIPPPAETVHVYGDVFLKIAVAAIASSVILFALAPLLARWMHEEAR